MSGTIDNSVDASFEAWPNTPEHLGTKFSELGLSFGGLFFTPAAILKILRDQFSNASRFERIQYLLDAFRMNLKAVESQLTEGQSAMKAVQERLETPRFQAAVSAACEEAARASEVKRIQRLAAVLAASLTTSQWAARRRSRNDSQ